MILQNTLTKEKNFSICRLAGWEWHHKREWNETFTNLFWSFRISAGQYLVFFNSSALPKFDQIYHSFFLFWKEKMSSAEKIVSWVLLSSGSWTVENKLGWICTYVLNYEISKSYLRIFQSSMQPSLTNVFGWKFESGWIHWLMTPKDSSF